MFMAYHQLLADEGPAGDVLEIGVHHGLSAIGTAALRGDGPAFRRRRSVRRAPVAKRVQVRTRQPRRFLANMRRFYDDLSFLTAIAAPSSTLRAADLGSGSGSVTSTAVIRSPKCTPTCRLVAAISSPGGLIALDDYFNPAFPGVGEAAVRFCLEHPGTLRPIAIGFNKVLFQREPAPFPLEAAFAETFPHVSSSQARLFGQPVRLFDAAFGAFFDAARSTPRRLVAAEGAVGARLVTGGTARDRLCRRQGVGHPCTSSRTSRAFRCRVAVRPSGCRTTC